MTPLPGTDLGKRKSLLLIAEKDTSLVDLQHVVTDPPPAFTREGLQMQIAKIYQDGYKLRYMPGAVIRSLRPIFPLNRALVRAAMTVSVRILALKVIPTMLNSDPYTGDFLSHLRSLDYQDRLDQAKLRVEQSQKSEVKEEESHDVQVFPEVVSANK